jgi:molybdate/tungstate transport system permease protein
MPGRSWFGGASALAALLVALLVALPILALLGHAVGYGTLGAALADGAVRHALLTSFACAALATAVGVALGVPLAYLLARRDFRGKRWLEALLELPVVMPHPVVGIAVVLAYGRASLVGQGAGVAGISIVGAPLGIVFCMLFVGLPFLVSSAREGFALVDPRLEAVARTLGASPFFAGTRVALPLAARAIASGAVLMWARGVSEFGSIAIVTYHPRVASVLVYERFTTSGLPGALPVAGILVLVSLGVLGGLRALAGRAPALR